MPDTPAVAAALEKIAAMRAEKERAEAENARVVAEREAHERQQEADRAAAFAALSDLTDAERFDRLERAVAELSRWARLSGGPGVYEASPELCALALLHPEPRGFERTERVRQVGELIRSHQL